MDHNPVVDEETSLLTHPKRHRRPTKPLPRLQISIILLLQVCEPITSQSIYPYVNQLVSELDITGGDERKVGYYAGLIESLFFLTEAITVLQWSRISDHVGRKPVMLIGLFGLCLSMLSFGLSRTFWGLVISRCLCGLLNGNIGVMKSVMGELTDSSNRAEGFALMPVVWATGATLGPIMGGTLSRPHERFPDVFRGNFWKEYPYFLPCIATSSFVFIAFAITWIFFKETVPKRKPRQRVSHPESDYITEDIPLAHDEPVPLRQLLVYPIIISVSNYMSLAFLNISLNALLPLFFTMPVEIGGLGFEPATIGYIMGSYGAITGIFQAFYFAKVIRYLGERRIFVYGVSTFLPIFALFPIISLCAKRFGVNAIVWICIAAMLIMMAFMDMAFGCIFMYITASAPSKRSLGATNGLSQTTVSIARAIGPAMATSLFSVSVEHNLLGGYAVYAILLVFSSFAVFLGLQLPHEMWEEADDDYY
ncbi:Efflux pump azaL [Hypsizygus marmoreus]|uniref:Efflux pump azaL n=1 Tax=Hypsizygus marmoreus TaxID=39966 RepID=A0A369K2M3_HYPMA|nr:Efflux pump azaL [Hypsizygus marmoreus]